MNIRSINLLVVSEILLTFALSFSGSTGSILVKISRILVVFAYLVSLILGKVRLSALKNGYTLWSFLFIGFCAFSYIWAVSKKYATENLTSQLYIIIPAVIISGTIIENREVLFKLIKAVIWGSVAHGIYIYGLNGPLVYLSTRGSGDLENSNTLGYVSSAAIVFCYILLYVEKKQKNLYKVLMVANVVFAVLTASRKVYIFIGIFFVIALIMKTKNPVKVFRNFIVLCILAIAGYYSLMRVDFLYELVGERFETMLDGFSGENTDASTGFRLQLIQWGLEWFKNRPILGYGNNCYAYLLGSTYNTWAGSEGVYAHNNYIELMVDLGVFGLLIYYSFYICSVFHALREHKYNTLAIYSIAIFVSMVVTEYGQITYDKGFMQIVLLLAWSLSLSIFNTKNGGKNGKRN